MRLSTLGLLSLPLLMLGGCSAKPLTRTETILLSPPAALLADCPETQIQESGSNGDFLEVAKMLRIDLAECNRSKARLREWLRTESKKGKEGK